MQKNILFIGVGVLIVWGIFLAQKNEALAPPIMVAPVELATTTVQFAGTSIVVEIADTDASRTLGLSGRRSLSEGRGMFFIFPEPVSSGFWMKDMYFPIDIIWFDEAGSVVSFVQGADPASYPEVYYPSRESKYVLEVPVSFIERYNVAPGMQFSAQHMFPF